MNIFDNKTKFDGPFFIDENYKILSLKNYLDKTDNKMEDTKNPYYQHNLNNLNSRELYLLKLKYGSYEFIKNNLEKGYKFYKPCNDINNKNNCFTITIDVDEYGPIIQNSCNWISDIYNIVKKDINTSLQNKENNCINKLKRKRKHNI